MWTPWRAATAQASRGALPLVVLSVTWKGGEKDEAAAAVVEWHAGNVCHFMTGLSSGFASRLSPVYHG